jgi:hypothetical protein
VSPLILGNYIVGFGARTCVSFDSANESAKLAAEAANQLIMQHIQDNFPVF